MLMVALPEKVLWICVFLSGAALCSSTLQSGGEGVKETLPCAVEAVAVFPLPTVGGVGGGDIRKDSEVQLFLYTVGSNRVF